MNTDSTQHEAADPNTPQPNTPPPNPYAPPPVYPPPHPYGAPPPMPFGPPQDNSVMTVGDWVVTLLVMMIPCVNLVMMFVWAFGNGNQNRRNYCRATLIFMGVGVILYLIGFMIFGAMLGTILDFI